MLNINKKLVVVYSLLIAITVISAVCAVTVKSLYSSDGFITPSFDKTAISGVPDKENIKGYSEINAADGYKIGICGNPNVTDNNVKVYLTSFEDNNVWIKVRILDTDSNIIGESGLIKPGQYIESVKLNKDITENQNIEIKVMAYQPKTYYSEGTVTLKTTLVLEK